MPSIHLAQLFLDTFVYNEQILRFEKNYHLAEVVQQMRS